MIRAITTSDLPTADRFPAWREIVANYPAPMRITSRHARDFVAKARGLELGPVAASATEHPPVQADRTPALIRRSDPETFLLVLNVLGGQRVDRGRQSAVAHPGDLTLYHSSYPTCATSDPSLGREQLAFVSMPQRELPLSVGALNALIGVPMSGRSGIGSVVAAHLRALTTADVLDPDDAWRLGQITLDLVSLMLARQLDTMGRLPAETSQNARYALAQAFINARLDDPRLTPDRVAAAQYISLRSLQRLFQADGTTVAKWIMSQRLERCRRDLADPSQIGKSVSQIAFRWGFADQAHFSRAFRLAYGVSPTEFRRDTWRSEPK